MSVRQTLLAATTVSIVAFAMSPASSQTLRYANQGDLKSLDPYTLKETTTIAHHAHVYEGLTGARQGPEDHSGAGRKLGNAGADPLALPPAQGRQIPQWRPLHRRRRGVLRRPRARQGLQFPDQRSGRRQVRQGRRLHGRREAELAQSHSHFAMGYLVHHGQEMVRGEQLGGPDAGRGDHAELCLAQRKRHRPLHHREPSARREDRVQGQPELVAQARAQSEGNHFHADRLGCDARRGAAVGRSRRHRTGSDPGHRAGQFEPECGGAEGARIAHHLPRHGPDPRRTAVFERQGQESVQGHPRSRGVLTRRSTSS